MGTYKLKKGYDIRITGAPEKTVATAPAPKEVAVDARNFIGSTLKLGIKAGAKVKAGTVLFYDKTNQDIKFTSPVSGEVKEVVRGQRRSLQEIVIIPDGKNESESFKNIGSEELLGTSREDVLEQILAAGAFPFFIQRPFAVIPDPTVAPRDIFVSAFFTAPLAPEINLLLEGNEAAFQAGLNALTRLTDGKVNLSIDGSRSDLSSALTSAANVEVHKFSGPHPAGNVGIQAHHIKPVNKGETVWTISPQGVIAIGKLFLEGKVSADRTIAIAGELAPEKKHFKVTAGAKLSSILGEGPTNNGKIRVIGGDVLTGATRGDDSYLGFYDQQITIIPEVVGHEFMGWALPGFGKESFSRTFFSFLQKGKKFSHDTGYHGGVRAFVETGKYESVLPMDVYPVHLIKSIMYQDFEEMESLGIFEVAPEDFALCDYVCVSKIEAQAIIRQGLEQFRKEG